MAYENKAFTPQSPAQLKREYMETPFWFSKFQPGSQLTIVEDLPRNKPMRFEMRPSNKGGPAYAVNLIKITDGFVSKDVELSKTNAQLLFSGLPDSIENLRGCTFANDAGRWVFVAQSDMGQSFQQNAQKSPKDASGQTNTNQVDGLYLKLAQSVTLCTTIGQKTTKDVVVQIARNIVQPGQDVEAFIHAAKMAGWLVERDGVYSGTA